MTLPDNPLINGTLGLINGDLLHKSSWVTVRSGEVILHRRLQPFKSLSNAYICGKHRGPVLLLVHDRRLYG